MKKNTTLSLLLILALALALPVPMHADETNFPKTPEGVHLKKSVTQSADNDRLYTITLESYVTGTTIVTESKKTIPCDIVLVLDNSGSMGRYNITTTGSRKTGNINDTNTYFIKINGKTYYLKRFSQSRNYYWQYKKDSAPTAWNDGTTLYQGQYLNANNYEIYNQTSITRKEGLRRAAAAFIQSVYENNPEDGYHKIAIVWYGKNAAYGNTLGDYNLHDLTEATKNNLVTNFNNGSEIPTTGDNTYCDLGLAQAYTILNNVKTDGRNKVTVFFTDGEPGSTAGKFQEARARNSIIQSNNLKSSDLSNTINGNTFPSRVYAIGLMTNGTAGEHDPHPNNRVSTVDNDKYRFMHYTSSNYDVSGKNFSSYKFNTDFTDLTCQGATDDGSACAGHGSEDPHGYFTKSDGSNLEEIFSEIATASSKPQDVYDLKETSMIVLDVMSSYFRLPEGTDPEDIKVYKSKCTDINGNDTTWAAREKLEVGKDVQVVVDGKEVSVTGFDFASNFVGKHPVSEGSSDLEYGGYKLIFEVKIEVDPDNVGGATLYTNDAKSGIYAQDKNDPTKYNPIAGFERPTVSLPNIIIRAYGLDPGESASYTIYKIFTEKDVITAKGDYSFKAYNDAVIDETFTPIHVIITQEAGSNSASAKIKLNDEGRYKVVEDSWSYTYNLEVYGRGSYSKDTDSHRWTVSGTDTTFLVTTMPTDAKVAGNSIIRTVCYGTQAKVNDDPTRAANKYYGHGTPFDFQHTKAVNTSGTLIVPPTHVGEAAKKNWAVPQPKLEGGENGEGGGTPETPEVEPTNP